MDSRKSVSSTFPLFLCFALLIEDDERAADYMLALLSPESSRRIAGKGERNQIQEARN